MKIKIEMMKLIFSSMVVGSVLLLLLVGMVGCNKNNDPELPSAHDVQLDLLANSWTVKNETNGVSLAGADEMAHWPNFSVTLTNNKTYTATDVSVGREVVWPASGTWDFKSDTDLNTIIRDDGVEIAVIVDEENLKMTFTYIEPGGRVDGTEGLWIFNMQ